MSLRPTLEPFKQGDTFALACVYKENDAPASLVGFTIKSQIRDSSGVLVAELVATIDPDQDANKGKFSLTFSPTDEWPVDACVCDIEYTTGGVKNSTETFIVPVEADVTRG